MEEEERLKKNLQKSEAAVAEYKLRRRMRCNSVVAPQPRAVRAGAGSAGSRGGLVEDKLQEFSIRLTAAKAERLRLEAS